MELSDRIKRPKTRVGQSAALPDQTPRPDEAIPATPPSGAPGTFDRWLDGQLRALYRTVLNEPLPREILELLSRRKGEDPE